MDKPKRRRPIWPWLLLAGLFLMLVFAVAFLMLIASAVSPEKTVVAKGSVLEVNLSGALAEGPSPLDLGPLFGGGGTSLWDLRRGLKEAADDPKIVGVRLMIHNSLLGWGAAEEVLQHLDRFRASGKPVYALLQSDMIGDLDYFLATGADRIWMSPEAGAVINGLVAEAQFVRGSLEKLHIEPQAIMYKEYKSAGEMFANYEMSPYMRESLTAMLETTQNRFNQRVNERRKVVEEALVELIGQGMAVGPQLVERGLVDELGYIDQVDAAFAELPDVDDYRGVRLSKYVGTLERESGGDRIAVVFGEGVIVAEPPQPQFPLLFGATFSGPAVASHLRRAIEDERVKAILFRVNSPGGSAVGSDLVRREVERAREAGKPVVVSMGNVAASGGYWVSMHADGIVAQATTVTGSIGVVFTHLNLDGFYEWLGTGIDRITSAPNANLMGFGPWDESNQEAVLVWMDRIYESFTEQVAAGRDLELERVQELARGRVWTGEDALERQLVDRVGGIDEALELVREAAGLDPDRDYPLVVYPRPKSLFERLLEDEWVSSTETLLRGSRLRQWVEEAARPQVLVKMPEFRVH